MRRNDDYFPPHPGPGSSRRGLVKEHLVPEEAVTQHSGALVPLMEPLIEIDWSRVTNQPAVFPSDIPNVSGLQAALDDKKPLSWFPTWSEVTSKPTTFPPSAHTQDWSTILNRPVTSVAILDGLDARVGDLEANPQSSWLCDGRYEFDPIAGFYSLVYANDPSGLLPSKATPTGGPGADVEIPFNFGLAASPSAKIFCGRTNVDGKYAIVAGSSVQPDLVIVDFLDITMAPPVPKDVEWFTITVHGVI